MSTTINYYPANYITNAVIMSWSYNGTPGSQTSIGNISFPSVSGPISSTANQVVLLTFNQSLLSQTTGAPVAVGQHFNFTYTTSSAGNGFLIQDSQSGQYYATDGYVVSPNQLALVLNTPINILGPTNTKTATITGLSNVTVEGTPLITGTTVPVNNVTWNFSNTGGVGTGYVVQNTAMPTITPQEQTYAYVQNFVNYSTSNNNALNSSVSTTPLANGGQITNPNGVGYGVANPAAEPITIAFQLSPSLIYYLYTLGYQSLPEMYNAVTVSIPAASGTAFFPGLTVNSQTTAGQTTTTDQGVTPLYPSTNYTLAQLSQSFSSANFHHPVSITLPNIQLNDFMGGALQFGIAGVATTTPTQAAPSAQLAYQPFNLTIAPAAGSNGFIANIEPHIGTLANATGTTIDNNADITNINAYSIPISLETYNRYAAPFNLTNLTAQSNYNGTLGNVFNINGGAGWYNQLSNSTAIYQALVGSSLSGKSDVVNNVPLGPSNGAVEFSKGYPFHDWTHYWDSLANGTNLGPNAGKLFTPTQLVSGGTIKTPTNNGGNTYSFTSYIFDGTGGTSAGGYAILVNNTPMYGTGTPGTSGFNINGVSSSTPYAAGSLSIYVPFDGTAPNAATLFNTGTAFLTDPAGLYGANAGYAIYYNQNYGTGQGQNTNNLYTVAQKGYATNSGGWAGAFSAVAKEFSNETQLFSTNLTSNAPSNNTATRIVGDLEAGINYGLVGSQTNYSNGSDINTSTPIGQLMSYQWFEAQSNGGNGLSGNIGPVAAGYWGPWAQPLNASTVAPATSSANQNTNLINADWNTWAFSVGGATQPTTSTVAPNIYYAQISNLTHGAISPLEPNVYNFAYADRVLQISTQFAPTTGGTNAPSGPSGSAGGAGFELVTLGSPATYYNGTSTSNFSFNNTNQLQYWYAAVDYNVTSLNIITYAAQLDGGTTPTTVINNIILNDPITTGVVNPVISFYQTALGRVPGVLEAAKAVNHIDGATMTQAPINPGAAAVNASLQAGAVYLFATSEFKNDLATAGVQSPVAATTMLSSLSSSDLNSYLTYLYKNDWGANYQNVLTPAVIQYFQTSGLTASQALVSIATHANAIAQLTPYITVHQQAEINQTEIGATGFIQGQPLQSLLFYHT